MQTLGDSGRIVLSNAKYFHVTPYTDEDTIGNTTYDIKNIVGDTLAITPDDNTVNSKESEFKDDPLFENITLGKIQFAGTCIDFRNDVMTEIFGWEKEDNNVAVFAPTAYKDKYAVVEIGFHNEKTVVVIPKLKLNAKAVISTLKTGTSEGNLAGTAYSASVQIGKVTKESPMVLITDGEKTASYQIGKATFTVEKGRTTATAET